MVVRTAASATADFLDGSKSSNTCAGRCRPRPRERSATAGNGNGSLGGRRDGLGPSGRAGAGAGEPSKGTPGCAEAAWEGAGVNNFATSWG